MNEKHEKANKNASTGRVLGIIGMFAWLFPLAGFPITIIGLVKSVGGLESVEYHNKAVAGLTCSIIGLVLTVINSISGVIMYS